MIFRSLLLLSFSVISLSVFSAPVMAEDEAVKDEETMSVAERMSEFTKDFDEPSKRHFYALYGSYNLIKVVEDVQEQVENAIDKCIEANPDMKDALKTRYTDWDEAIEPIMEEAEANVDNMIKVQDYAKAREVRKVLKFTAKLRKKTAGDVEKYPVTSPEACEYLRAKMDETEDNLTSLLRSTLVSLPQSLIRGEEEEKEAAAEAAKKAEEEAAEAAKKAEEEAKAEAEDADASDEDDKDAE